MRSNYIHLAFNLRIFLITSKHMKQCKNTGKSNTEVESGEGKDDEFKQ